MFYYDEKGRFEEEDLLTNFSAHKLPLYEKAVKEFGDDTLYISDTAYDCRGRRLNGYCSLRTTIHKDRSDFWRLFNSLREEFKS